MERKIRLMTTDRRMEKFNPVICAERRVESEKEEAIIPFDTT